MGKAAKSFNGADGKSGIASPLVEIYAQRVEGNAEIISEVTVLTIINIHRYLINIVYL